jgi:hypothetical protein
MPGAPSVSTISVVLVTDNTAAVTGSVTTNGANCTVNFQYSVGTGYNTFTASQSVAGSNPTATFTQLIKNLLWSSTYHVRAAASSVSGSAVGTGVQFKISDHLVHNQVVFPTSYLNIYNPYYRGDLPPDYREQRDLAICYGQIPQLAKDEAKLSYIAAYTAASGSAPAAFTDYEIYDWWWGD